MKKVLSIILVIALVLGMSAVTALADTAYNGDVAGVLTQTGTYTFEGTLTGDLTLHISGQATSESGNYTYFEGTVTGDITGDIENGVLNAGGLDTLYADITNIPGCSSPVRIVGVFLQSGTDGDFEGQIITGTAPAPVSSLTIGTTGGVTEVTVGQTLQMTATTVPTGDYNINWSVYVNDRDKAWINEDGLLHALAPGSVTVIANTEDPNVATDTLTINVLPADTEVTANVNPTYTITIPAVVDFGTLIQDQGPVSQPFTVSASGVVIDKDGHIDVGVANSPFEMTDQTGTETLGFTLENSTVPVVPGGTYATFTGNADEVGTVSVDTDEIEYAGSYRGTMDFVITYE